MNKKRVLGIILSIILVLGLTPGICMTARADDTPVLWVGGTLVDSEHMSGSGWSFNPDSNTLTLNDANINGSLLYQGSSCVILYDNSSEENFTIELKGPNSVNGLGLLYNIGIITMKI